VRRRNLREIVRPSPNRIGQTLAQAKPKRHVRRRTQGTERQKLSNSAIQTLGLNSLKNGNRINKPKNSVKQM